MTPQFEPILAGLAAGEVVPFLGPGVLADVSHSQDGRPIPATSDQLILALNRGQPMAAKLMYEFPRAAMNIELKHGRSAVNHVLKKTYDDPAWSEAAIHRWLADLNLPYIIDLNRDTGLQRLYAKRPHTLIVGVSRISGTAFRFKLYRHDGEQYGPATDEAEIDPNAPILFKPCGTPWPEPNWVASDADYVDYLTELMGGLAIPPFLKARRVGLKYLVAGARLNRDTTRMLLSDIMYAAAQPAGWALIADANAKEQRFCARLGLELVDAEIGELAGIETAPAG